MKVGACEKHSIIKSILSFSRSEEISFIRKKKQRQADTILFFKTSRQVLMASEIPFRLHSWMLEVVAICSKFSS
jgi:hypothetical protein